MEMHSQQATRRGGPASRRAWLLLWVAAWALAQALALGHRLGHAPHAGGLPAWGLAAPGSADHGHDHGHGHSHGQADTAHEGPGAWALVAALAGGEHDNGEPQCRIVDQLGLGEALPHAALPTACVPTGAPSPAAAGLPVCRAVGHQPYDARAPPLA